MTRTQKDGEFATAFSMDNEEIYGSKVMVTYHDAIHNKLICDYKVAIVILTKEDIRRHTIQQGRVDDTDSLTIAHEIALQTMINKYGAKKFISFHRKIEQAKTFANEKTSCMPEQLHCQFIKGAHSRAERNDILA